MADASVAQQFGLIAATGAVGLVSVYAGRRWERSGGHEEWLRNERLRVYASYLASIGTLIPVMVRDAANTNDELRAVAMAGFGEVAASAAQVALLGPAAAEEAAEELQGLLLELWQQPHGDPDS